jgi:hypothetical protein
MSQSVTDLNDETVNSPVCLEDDASFSGIHFALEKLVFWRLAKWKNQPRTNFLFLRACLIVATMLLAIVGILSVAVGIGYLVGSESAVTSLRSFRGEWPKHLLHCLLGFFSAVSVLFWNLEKEFKGRLMYCNSVYNESLKCTTYGLKNIRRLSILKKDLLSNSLAIDLLYFDLWAHYSLKELFAQELEEAIQDYYQPGNPVTEAIKRINSGKMGEIEASKLLHNRQSMLLAKEAELLRIRSQPETSKANLVNLTKS